MGHGGARPGAGRKPGIPNKLPKEVKELAKQHTALAIDSLVRVLGDVKSPAIAVVKAAEVLLDRGHGRPTQHIEAKISPLDDISDDDLSMSIAALQQVVGLADEEVAGNA